MTGQPKPHQAILQQLLEDAQNSQETALAFRRELQHYVISHLVIKFGGVRKAAEAAGQSAGNFANFKSGKRLATVETLVRMAKPLLP
jgi:hypothetical protein